MVKFIALYLPQYHPIKENSEWYGEGFTEWTNVAKAKPLFKGHYQPHIPADLGFYDLRLKETRVAQAELAQKYGISAFCYWTYWFGDGKMLLDMPMWKMHEDKDISLSFCLGWANHSWEKKLWDEKGTKELLMEQQYLGSPDYEKFFYKMLPLFKDKRYFKINGKLFFMIWQPLANDEIKKFIKVWNGLAEKENLSGFYFVGRDSDCRDYLEIKNIGFDAIYDDNALNIHHKLGPFKKVLLKIKRHIFKLPTIFKYKDACKYMITNNSYKEDVIPSVAPNFDHSPRSGGRAFVLSDCRPEYFYSLVKKAIDSVRDKPIDKQLIIIKSWNEWGEGNHMEPDLKYGKAYLEALKQAIREEEK